MNKKGQFFLLFLFTFALSTCWGSVDFTPMEAKHSAIHTYGGGILLQKVFNSISLLIYGNTKSGIDQTFNSIIRIALTVGGFCCGCIALFREKYEPLIKNFFLPGLGIMCLLLVPRTTVYIQDHLAQKATSTQAIPLIKVENVPFFLGQLATLVSTVSYQFTNALESVAHGVNDKLYDWTGHIYAGENIFLTKKCRIANPILEDNFREFCRECVFRDLGLGIYSKEELIQHQNILKFLGENTSKIRTMYYKDISPADPDQADQGAFIPCREAMQKMNALFDGKKGNTKDILIGEIGNDFELLLRQGQPDLSKLIKQQIAINLLKEEIPGTLNSFASRRAELLQKENQKILGALGANAIVAMRNFFEATIYMVFPLIVLISLLSFGIKPLVSWVHFILWINTWPIFFVVMKFLLSTIWEFRTGRAFGDSYGLTIFTSEGLADLYSSMESIAAISMAFIPFLSWILLKGGVSQMVQLASSIMSPAQTAASTAAAEKTYGNYSYGNVNLDNVSGYNANLFRQGYNGQFSQGSVSIDSGTQTTTFAPSQGEVFIRQSDSYLREGITKTKAFGNALQNSYTASENTLYESSQAVTDGITSSATKSAGLVQALSRQFQTGENYNLQENSSLQQATQFFQGIAKDYASSTGVNQDQALREVFSGGIGFSFGLKGNFETNHQDGVSSSTSHNFMEKATDSNSFQKHWQTITNASKGEMANVLGSEDARLHQDLVHSLNTTASSVDQWRAAKTEHESISQLKSDSESDNLSMHQNLNQRFVSFLQEKYHTDPSKMTNAIELPNETPEKQEIVREFIKDFIPKSLVTTTSEDMSSSYSQFANKIPTPIDAKTKEEGLSKFVRDQESTIERSFGDAEKRVERFHERVNRETDLYQTGLETEKQGSERSHSAKTAETQTNVKKQAKMLPYFLEEAVSVNVVKNAMVSSRKNPSFLAMNYKTLFGYEDNQKNPGE